VHEDEQSYGGHQVLNPQYILDVIIPLSQASYDTRLPLPSGYSLVAPIMVDTTIVPEPKTGRQFGIIVSGPDGIHIVPRGTQDLEEWLVDFDALDHVLGPVRGTWMHGGIWRMYVAIEQSILKAIPFSSPLNISGHSLGGGVATFLAMMFSARKPKTITLASPRVVNGAYAKLFHADITRIANRWDIVPHEPNSDLGYEHVGEAVLIDGGLTFDLKKAHNLGLSYAPGVSKLLPAPAMPLAA
jgi:lipase (class 3)